jgi:Periplasmic binding protein domain
MDNAARADRTWRAGVLCSRIGVISTVKRSQLQATLLAIAEINTSGCVMGRVLASVSAIARMGDSAWLWPSTNAAFMPAAVRDRCAASPRPRGKPAKAHGGWTEKLSVPPSLDNQPLTHLVPSHSSEMAQNVAGALRWRRAQSLCQRIPGRMAPVK